MIRKVVGFLFLLLLSFDCSQGHKRPASPDSGSGEGQYVGSPTSTTVSGQDGNDKDGKKVEEFPPDNYKLPAKIPFAAAEIETLLTGLMNKSECRPDLGLTADFFAAIEKIFKSQPDPETLDINIKSALNKYEERVEEDRESIESCLSDHPGSIDYLEALSALIENCIPFPLPPPPQPTAGGPSLPSFGEIEANLEQEASNKMQSRQCKEDISHAQKLVNNSN